MSGAPDRGRELVGRSEVEAVLAACRTVVVLGAHHQPHRAAFYVPEYLHRQGMAVFGTNPKLVGTRLWGHNVVASPTDLEPADFPDGIDVLDVYRRSDAVIDHVDEILAMRPRPRLVWLQLGIRNDDAAAQLLANGIDVIQDRCMLADHRAWGVSPVR